ncbi:MAG: ribonuclease Y [Motilibacteraceae bacterium]
MNGTDTLVALLLVAIALLAVAVAALLFLLRRAEVRAARFEREAAEQEAGARAELEREAQALRADLRDQRQDVERREHRLAEREARLDAEGRALEERAGSLAQQAGSLAQRAEELAVRRAELGDLQAERRRVLESAAGVTMEQARAEIVAAAEQQAKRDAARLVRDLERAARREAEARARDLVVGAIQRVASEQTAESVVTSVALPGDDYKGRIIGREGRNVRAFEAVTGVTLIIDDAPEAVLLSCFDPVRRETARLTLEALVLDGRISPHRIEEQHARSEEQVAELCRRAGEAALVEVGLTDLHPELVATLGALRYRTSFGQNVLRHLVESAHLAGLMAGELGVDVALAKRCALLHDLGKALTHEAEGSHAAVGAELARRYGEDEDVVHAIAAHHGEVEPRTVEAVLTQAADAISGSRPGARRESMQAYVSRLERLEAIALAHEGVAKVFAMQAGREVRVMVLPDVVDDIAAQVLARDIAKQVEEELTYPGQIRVTVVRESRAIEYAR